MSARHLHVGLNLIFLVPGETGGMEVYARELIPALVAAAPDVSFTAFINRETAAAGNGPWGELLRAVVVPVNARSRAQWVIGEQALLPRLAARERVDLLHSLASTAPAWGSFRRVLTVHDLIYARLPEAHGGLRALGMRALVPLAVRGSHRLIADSQSTKRDLVELQGTAPERIDVVPLGFGARQRVVPMPEPELRQRLDLGQRRVLLSLSAKRPHKNLLALIGALARIPAERRPLLMLPGYRTWHEQQLHKRAQDLGVQSDVRLLDWVADDELEGLWSAADAFVYPSLYEGFGLPVLEAMARGVPVACANASSLPEVAGEAALLFDPRSEAGIAAAIERLLADAELRATLRTAGVKRAAQFTWERTAQLTLASYGRASAGAGSPKASAALSSS
jgi:glycosyltransferase involved in cell wall biosynthesis